MTVVCFIHWPCSLRLVFCICITGLLYKRTSNNTLHSLLLCKCPLTGENELTVHFRLCVTSQKDQWETCFSKFACKEMELISWNSRMFHSASNCAAAIWGQCVINSWRVSIFFVSPTSLSQTPSISVHTSFSFLHPTNCVSGKKN